MRVSTQQFFRAGLNTMLDQQQALLKSQEQISTGKKISVPSDDPVASSRITLMNQRIELTESLQLNREFAQNRLSTQDSLLANVSDNIIRLKELMVQSNNGSYNSDDRQAIANEVRPIIDSLLSIANYQDSNGHYIFSGAQASEQPYTFDGTSYTYHGDDTNRKLPIANGVNLQITHSGKDIFSEIKNGNGDFQIAVGGANTGTGIISPGKLTNTAAFNAAFSNAAGAPAGYTIEFSSPTTYWIEDDLGNPVVGTVGGNPATDPVYTAEEAINFNGMTVSIMGEPNAGDSFDFSRSNNQSLFDTAQDFITALEQESSTALGRTSFQNEINRLSTGLDNALGNVLNVRTEVGARTNTAEEVETVNNDFILASKQTLSLLEDADITQAAIELNSNTVALQAAQQSYMKIQGLSLFNYL